MAGVKNLRDFGSQDKNAVTERIDDILNKPVTIHDVAFHDGENGEFSVFHASTEDGVMHTILSGGFLVLDALKDVDQQKAFPVEATFIKVGRTFTMK